MDFFKKLFGKKKETEVFTSVNLGDYLVVAEFCKFMDPSEYSGLELQIQL